jgi:hypothetical protein
VAVSAEAARTLASGIAKIGVYSDVEFTIFSGAGIPAGAQQGDRGEQKQDFSRFSEAH